MIADAQRPLVYSGFKMATLNLQTFNKVKFNEIQLKINKVF